MTFEERSLTGNLSFEAEVQKLDMYNFCSTLARNEKNQGLLIIPEHGEVVTRTAPKLSAESAAAWAKANNAIWLQQGRFTGPDFYKALRSFTQNMREDRKAIAQESFDALKARLASLDAVSFRPESVGFDGGSLVISGHLKDGEKYFAFDVDYHGGSRHVTPEIMLVTRGFFGMDNLAIIGYAIAAENREFAALSKISDAPRAIAARAVLADAERIEGEWDERKYYHGSFTLNKVKGEYGNEEGRLVYMSPRDVLEGKRHIEEDILSGRAAGQTLDEMMPKFMDVTRKLYRIAHADRKEQSDQVARYLALAEIPVSRD